MRLRRLVKDLQCKLFQENVKSFIYVFHHCVLFLDRKNSYRWSNLIVLINDKMLNHDININETTKGLNTVITQIFEGVNDTVFSLEKCLVVIT